MLDYPKVCLYYCMLTEYSSKLLRCLKHLFDKFLLINKEILIFSVYTFSWKKRSRQEDYYCYCGYLLVIVTSLETQSVRTIDLARALRAYTFTCHFMHVAIEFDAHIRSSHFLVSLPLTDYQKNGNIDTDTHTHTQRLVSASNGNTCNLLQLFVLPNLTEII
jgi:hypothetical protein